MMMLQKWFASTQPKAGVIPTNSQTWYTAVTLPIALGAIETANQRFENIEFFNQISQQSSAATTLSFFPSKDEAAKNRYPYTANWAVIAITNLPFELEKATPLSSTFPEDKRLTTEMISSAHIVFSDPASEDGCRFVEIHNPGHSSKIKQRH